MAAGVRLSCGHIFCRGCISFYLDSKITSAELPLVCPHVGEACLEPLAVEPLLRLVGSEHLYERHERFRLMQEHPMARDCPHVRLAATLEPSAGRGPQPHATLTRR